MHRSPHRRLLVPAALILIPGLFLGALLVPASDGPAPLAPGEGKAAAPAEPKAPAGRPAQAAGQVEIPPRAGGRPGPIEAGEAHALTVLQALADGTRKTVLVSGREDILAERIRVDKALEAPTREELTALLAVNGWAVSEETFRGEPILLVIREVRPTGRRGSLVRPGQEAPRGGPVPEAGSAGAAPIGGRVRMYRRDDGTAEGWMVVLETGSRVEAENARSLLESYLQGRAGKKAGPVDTGKK
jgi:hypothetical protein